MTQAPGHHVDGGRPGSSEYRRLPLDELVRRIALDGDRRALDEFHQSRPIFRINDGCPMLFIVFIEAVLRGDESMRFLGVPAELRERAYDLTVDKFFHLPPEASRDAGQPLKRNGPDCRYYFRMLYRAIQAWRKRHPGADALRTETAATRIVQRHVARHCRLSYLEARRSLRPGWSRYRWHCPTGSITVWMPGWFDGARRRPWLESHVPAPDPNRPGEKERVQAIIDTHFGTFQLFALDEGAHASTGTRRPDPALDCAIEQALTIHGLAVLVANEKALRLPEQRPAIRRLGKRRLRALVKRIFEDLASDCLEDQVVANELGISKATFSRFAGSSWKPGSDRPAPDLWYNTARVLACFRPFREVAHAAGVWDGVRCAVRKHGDWENTDE